MNGDGSVAAVLRGPNRVFDEEGKDGGRDGGERENVPTTSS